MVHVLRRRGWEIPERDATPESVYLGRREFLQRLGIAGAATLALGGAGVPAIASPGLEVGVPGGFIEFSDDPARAAELAERLVTRPWRIETGGLVSRPRTIDADDLTRRMPIEERVSRHRGGEPGAMTVPWTGFPLRDLVAWANPLSSARFLSVASFLRPDQAPHQGRATWYPWPYREAYRLDEAMHELAFVATGAYGAPLSAAHGAPLRITMPWKYGWKSVKSIVRLEFTAEQPSTFWPEVAPEAFDFLGNVDPRDTRRRQVGGAPRPTIAFNGYGEWVARLYGRDERRSA